MKKVFLIVLMLLMPAAVVGFNHDKEIAEGKELVDSGVACDGLNEDQLEAIGEFYMEEMHPGEAHDYMHQRMGLAEGSTQHRLFHVNLANRFYCGDMEEKYYSMSYSTKKLYPTALKGLYFVVGSFVFSAIFWLTHRWLIGDKKTRKR